MSKDGPRPHTSMVQSGEIAVRHYQQILMWPLAMRSGQEAADLDDVTERLVAGGRSGSGAWEWPDRERWARGERDITLAVGYEGDEDYSEIVYFHSFVRAFLYGDRAVPPEERPIRVLTRADISLMDVRLSPERHFVLPVHRVELYLFDTGVAILMVDFSASPEPDRWAHRGHSEQLSLRDLLDLQNRVRHMFPRRWDKKTGSPKECPLTITWKPGPEDACSDFRDDGAFLSVPRASGALPIAPHWQYLLRPLRPRSLTPTDGAVSHPSYEPLGDQRLPSMVLVGVDDPRQISEWDYARLVFMDAPGDARVAPCSEDFLSRQQEDYTYDRFWLKTPLPVPAENGEGIAAHNSQMTTRWLCSGYGFAGVGHSDPERTSFLHERLIANFRHHYFRMGLIAHFQRASLLRLRERLADAVKALETRPLTTSHHLEFAAQVGRVRSAFMHFRSRYWFEEVSTQLQGQELFRRWSERLDNPALFDQVAGDLDSAAVIVTGEVQQREARTVTFLTWIAMLAAGAGIAVGVMSLGAIRPEHRFDVVAAASWGAQSVVALVITLLSLVGLFILAITIVMACRKLLSPRVRNWFSRLWI